MKGNFPRSTGGRITDCFGERSLVFLLFFSQLGHVPGVTFIILPVIVPNHADSDSLQSILQIVYFSCLYAQDLRQSYYDTFRFIVPNAPAFPSVLGNVRSQLIFWFMTHTAVFTGEMPFLNELPSISAEKLDDVNPPSVLWVSSHHAFFSLLLMFPPHWVIIQNKYLLRKYSGFYTPRDLSRIFLG